MQLQWEIEGERQLSRRLRILSDRLKDWGPAFEETADNLKKTFSHDTFRTQGAIIGQKWSPLSRAYAARKAQRFPGKDILEATGRMRRSFRTLWRADMAAIWNDADYFKYHQSKQPRTKMPRRAMMYLAERQRQQIVKIFHAYYRRALRTA